MAFGPVVVGAWQQVEITYGKLSPTVALVPDHQILD